MTSSYIICNNYVLFLHAVAGVRGVYTIGTPGPTDLLISIKLEAIDSAVVCGSTVLVAFTTLYVAIVVS